tara:strand:+ start:2123 stop:2653 length:531 start_codon:yes stop_codon:yes gene_type:complete
MPLSSAWEKLRKPILIGAYIISSMVVCFLSLHFTDAATEVLFEEVLKAFPTLSLFGTTLSVALFTYVDNISKEISAIRASKKKLERALSELGSLKREVIINSVFIIALYILDLAAKGVVKAFAPDTAPFEFFFWMILSIRFSLFTLAVLAVSVQVRGLLVAIEYRNVIHSKKASGK